MRQMMLDGTGMPSCVEVVEVSFLFSSLPFPRTDGRCGLRLREMVV